MGWLQHFSKLGKTTADLRHFILAFACRLRPVLQFFNQPRPENSPRFRKLRPYCPIPRTVLSHKLCPSLSIPAYPALSHTPLKLACTQALAPALFPLTTRVHCSNLMLRPFKNRSRECDSRVLPHDQLVACWPMRCKNHHRRLPDKLGHWIQMRRFTLDVCLNLSQSCGKCKMWAPPERLTAILGRQWQKISRALVEAEVSGVNKSD